MYKRALTKQPAAANDYAVGRGYIFIPFGVDREQFVQTALRNERVSLMLEDGRGSINDAYISKTVLQEISFPEKTGELGSPIAYLNIYPANEFTVIAVLSSNDNSQLLKEYQFKKVKESEIGRVSVIGNGDNGELIISVDGENEDSGKVILNIKNSENKGELEINVLGGTNIYTQGDKVLKSAKSIELQVVNNETQKKSSLKYEKDQGLIYLDEFSNKLEANKKGVSFSINTEKENQEEGEEVELEPVITVDFSKEEGFSYIDKFENNIKIDKDGNINLIAKNKLVVDAEKGIDIGSENLESAAKGDTLVDMLSDLCDKISALTVPTALGPSGIPINVADFTTIKSKLNTIKSNLVKVE